ncbi:MAG: isoaspartyl peptidase/L-asparaginase [Ignavibacteriales bacterium]|nr:MAG: isoaspartyl peptidase/L-asparaginase [Chlorobiota bacterium]MBE7477180.1 isoaspartyl peptidase/L-asparaginase [Ignavibacteriales bacterium]
MKIFSQNRIQSFLLLLIILLFFPSSIISQEANGKYTIVIHGGAGSMDPNMPESEKQLYINSLTKALKIGKQILEKGGSSLDAVEQVIRFLEDDSLFNAGRGAVFTSAGKNELDASIMDGRDLSSGAVAGVTIIKNPISLARLVKEKTSHVLFAGKGADELGKQFGVEIVDPSYFFVCERYEELVKMKEKTKGTVGCVAIDQYGNIAAGTSTGGRTGKMPGRVGDSPIINAGTYANNNTCGVSATGIGELFIKNAASLKVSILMEYENYTLEQAAEEVIFKILPENSGGIICVDKDYNYQFAFNTGSMMRAVATSEGIFEIKIWK